MNLTLCVFIKCSFCSPTNMFLYIQKSQMKEFSKKWNLFFKRNVERMVFVIRYPDMCSPSSPAKHIHERKLFYVRIIWTSEICFLHFSSLKWKHHVWKRHSILLQLDAIKVMSSHYDVHFVPALIFLLYCVRHLRLMTILLLRNSNFSNAFYRVRNAWILKSINDVIRVYLEYIERRS